MGFAMNDRIIESVCKRISSLARGLKVEEDVALVGGAAKIPFLQKALEEEMGQRFLPLPIDPRLTGALGAALLAEDALKG